MFRKIKKGFENIEKIQDTVRQLDIKQNHIKILEIKKSKLKSNRLDSAIERFSELENRDLKNL